MLKNLDIDSSFQPFAGVKSDSLAILGMLYQIEMASSAASFLIESIGLDILVIKLFWSYKLKVFSEWVGIVGVWIFWDWLKIFDIFNSSSAYVVNLLLWTNSNSVGFSFFQSCFTIY